MVDFGANVLDTADDYPDFVIPLAHAVAAGKVERGIAVCGSGVGASVCANKIHGVRAGLVSDHFSARQGVEDDHMNIICMGGRTLGPFAAWDILEAYLAAEFSQAAVPSAAAGQSCLARKRVTFPSWQLACTCIFAMPIELSEENDGKFLVIHVTGIW